MPRRKGTSLLAVKPKYPRRNPYDRPEQRTIPSTSIRPQPKLPEIIQIDSDNEEQIPVIIEIDEVPACPMDTSNAELTNVDIVSQDLNFESLDINTRDSITTKQQIQDPIESQQVNDHQTGGAVQPLIKWNLIAKEKEFRSIRLNAFEQWSTFDVEHNLKDFRDIRAYAEAIDNAFAEAMAPFCQQLLDNDRIGFYIESDDLNYKIYLRPQKVRPFDKERFLNQIYVTTQSNRVFLNSGHLKVRVLVIHSLSGSGRTTKAPLPYEELVKNKKSVIKVINTDDSCGYLAIAMGIKFYEWEVKGNSQQNRWHDLIRRETAQKKLGQSFCSDYGLDFDKPVDIDILKEIDSMIDYQIIVIKDCVQMFVGTDRKNVIYLLYDGTHYDFIKSMTAFLDKNIYCKYCNKGYTSAIQHRCEKVLLSLSWP